MTLVANSAPADEMQAALTAALDPGESLLWTGEPTPRELRRQTRGLVLVGLCFTAFGIFWIVATVREAMRYVDPHHGIPWALLGFPLGGAPFLGLGLMMTTTPLWRRRRAIRILYAVTDQRAIVLQGEMLTRRINVQSYTPDQIKQLAVIDRPVGAGDGSGDVIFDRVLRTMGKAKVLMPIGFFNVAGAAQVESLIRDRLLPIAAATAPK